MERKKVTDVSVRRVTFGEVYARVSTAGPERERGFVLVPGIGVSVNYFERLALKLNEFGPVHALDLPGFGGVPHPRRRRMRIRDYADLVGHVVDELALDDPVLIGHSMGAQVVADLAARYRRGNGEALTDIVLISPVINPHERRLRQAAWRFLQASLREPPGIAAMALYGYLMCGPRWFSRVLPEMMTYPIEDVLPEVESHTLLLTGGDDPLCPRYWTREACQLLSSGQAYEIAGAAHSVMHANAEDVARLCVQQARGQRSDDGRIHVVTEPEPADAPNPAVRLQEIAARFDELIGIASDDDERVAQAKTRHTEAEARVREDEDPAASV